MVPGKALQAFAHAGRSETQGLGGSVADQKGRTRRVAEDHIEGAREGRKEGLQDIAQRKVAFRGQGKGPVPGWHLVDKLTDEAGERSAPKDVVEPCIGIDGFDGEASLDPVRYVGEKIVVRASPDNPRQAKRDAAPARIFDRPGSNHALGSQFTPNLGLLRITGSRRAHDRLGDRPIGRHAGKVDHSDGRAAPGALKQGLGPCCVDLEQQFGIVDPRRQCRRTVYQGIE